MKPPKEISDIHVAQAMKHHGGNFVRRLGEAMLWADAESLRILKTAFPVIWKHYIDVAKLEKIESLAEHLHRANFETVAGRIQAPVFSHCNVCGCVLRGDSEHALGMCTAHANEGAGL